MRKEWKAAAAVTLLLFILSLSFGCTYAAEIISVYGKVETEGIDVSIDAEQESGHIAPGMTVAYRPVITNRGVTAYIRFRLEMDEVWENELEFYGLDEKNWVKRGEYFYYRYPVTDGTATPTFKGFHVKENNKEEMQDFMNKEFIITAYCDAVQAENFEPDFSGNQPWGNILIEDNDYETDMCYRMLKSGTESVPGSVNLSFKGTAEYTLSSESVLNENILPGDSFDDSVILTNEGNHPLDVYFSVSECEENSDSNLLDAVKLEMDIDGRNFYKGNLRAASLGNWTKIVNMEEGSAHRLSYRLYVPPELDNEYQAKNDYFVWNFTTAQSVKFPETGDETKLLVWLFICAASAVFLAVIKKRGCGNEKE